VRVELAPAAGGQQLARTLLADTGAGTANSRYQILLRDSDCRLCAAAPFDTVTLGRAYQGLHPVYRIRVRIPGLGFDRDVPVVGVAVPPVDFDGIACFRFLNRFTYGNFGDRAQFGLEL
jgi:hypothetical protein